MISWRPAGRKMEYPGRPVEFATLHRSRRPGSLLEVEGTTVLSCNGFLEGHPAAWSTHGVDASPAGVKLPTKLARVQLEILRGHARHRLRAVEVPVFLIGSAIDCDLMLGDDRFPEVHSYIYVTGAAVSVRHLGVGPQLWVDGQPTDSARLVDGDSIRLGDAYEFRVHLGVESRLADDGSGRILRFDRPQGANTPVGVSNRQVLLSPS